MVVKLGSRRTISSLMVLGLLASTLGILLVARPAAASPSPVLAWENFDVDPISSGKWRLHSADAGGANCASRDAAAQTYTLLAETPWCGTALISNTDVTSRCWEAEFRYRFLDDTPGGNDPSVGSPGTELEFAL